MIRIHGDSATEEGTAAHELKSLMSAAWPWLEHSADDQAVILSAAKCYGQRVQDLDLVVFLELASKRATFSPSGLLTDTSGASFNADRVRVESLCLVIEVKSHSPHNVRFVGPKV